MFRTDKRWFGFWGSSNAPDNHLPLFESWIDEGWRPTDWAELLNYVQSASGVIAGATPPMRCHICGEMHSSSSYQSDGVWLWPSDLIHYVTNHAIRLPDELVDHIRSNGYRPPELGFVDIEKLPWPEF